MQPAPLYFAFNYRASFENGLFSFSAPLPGEQMAKRRFLPR
jgi:hypothetical protein